jgi:hypothetical protein
MNESANFSDKKMDEPGISLEALNRLAAMEFDRGMEKVMRDFGFGDDDLAYKEIDGERQLVFCGKAVDFVKSHKKLMRRKFRETENAAMLKALEIGEQISELQKTGGRSEKID